MSAETCCWRCSKLYPMASETCPHCSATNANHNLDRAQVEMASGIGPNWNEHSDWRDHGPAWRGEA